MPYDCRMVQCNAAPLRLNNITSIRYICQVLFGLNSSLFAVLFAGLVALDTVEHNVQAQDDQQDRKDQLQTVGDKDSAPGSLTGGDGSGGSGRDGLDHCNQALHQSGEGDAEHDDQRREQHLVVAARDLEEDAQVARTRALSSWLAEPNRGQILA